MSVSACACKGIRSCNLCEPTKEDYSNELTSKIVFIYCDACRQAIRMDIYELNSSCPHHNEIGNNDIAFPLDGIYLVSDFLTENEEQELINHIDNDIWIPSQSGRLKQDFGIKINFKKQTIKTKYFTGMPIYSQSIIERLKSHRLLTDFQSVELCHLDYRSQRGSHIDPHIDDTWIWGERLITINLLSNTIVSLIPNNENNSNKMIYIPLPRRWMIVLYSDARYEYKHAIQRQHIQDRRLAVTFRELTGKNEKFYEENKELYERILRISQRFTGISVGRFESIVKEINSVNFDQMDIDYSSKQADQLKEIFQTEVSSLENLTPSTYLINNQLVKLFSHSIEQLKTIFSSYQFNENILDKTINDLHVVTFSLTDIKQWGQLIAQWRLITRDMFKTSWKNPYDNQWFSKNYASIIEKKKNSYPFLLSNLFTCQQQILLIQENQLEIGYLFMNNEESFYLNDLAFICLWNIDNIKEIIDAYEEIIRLTDDELNYLDIFLRLHLVLWLNEKDMDDEKRLDFLEKLSCNTFFVRNLVRS